MCEIFPEVNTCCLVTSVRIGMLLISILAIMSGVVVLSVMEKSSNINMGKVENLTYIKDPEGAASALSVILPSSISAISTIFMISGFILLFGTLSDDEGFVQVFVWLTFLAVVIGFIMVVAIAIECLLKPVCILKGLDWLSGSTLLIMTVAYLFLWIYFICVANTYVLKVMP
ncbi:uncharacterized protein LOC126977320 [Leptidea sinapis]|uniref:uncharacterized protein LOC126977320 n=1 Tax=Leptidea sinapis TaxID=189913 RepID=UPI00213BC5BE|nr:uncharacterized protein LOC126977320 [Leptidea sinapis]